MKVSELIEYLQTCPQDLEVVYRCYSEQCLLDVNDIGQEELCVAREDGWVQNIRLDKATQTYLVFPGN